MAVKHWNTGPAAARFRSQASSDKHQAPKFSSNKRQATSPSAEASSDKPKSTSSRILPPV